jgi:hypothetical protein
MPESLRATDSFRFSRAKHYLTCNASTHSAALPVTDQCELLPMPLVKVVS